MGNCKLKLQTVFICYTIVQQKYNVAMPFIGVQQRYTYTKQLLKSCSIIQCSTLILTTRMFQAL